AALFLLRPAGWGIVVLLVVVLAAREWARLIGLAGAARMLFVVVTLVICAAVALALAGARRDGDRVDRRYRRLFHRAPFRPAQARAADQPRQDMGRGV